MFHPLSIYVGLRYVRARSHKFFVSFITWASVIGVCVGVAALIVILSVMNGFEGELRERLLSLSAQVRVLAAGGSDANAGSAPAPVDWDKVAQLARTVPGVTAVTPYAELQALAVRKPDMLPVLLRGIEPEAPATRSELGRMITQGKLQDLTPGSGHLILSLIHI